jgi:hypothetical protein
MFVFSPIASLGAGVPWRGTATKPGELRLVAFAPDKWYVAVLTIPASD